MKNILVSILLIFYTYVGICQVDSSRKKIEYGLSLNTILRNDFNISPQLLVSYKGLTAKTGPIYGKSEMTYGYTSELIKKKINGGILTFQFNPNKKARIVDFFFVANFTFLKFKKNKFVSTPMWLNFYEEIKLSVFDQSFGYGFKIKFLKHFYITNDIAFGFSFKKSTYADGSVSRKKNEMSGSLLIGVGYYFNLKK